MKLSFPLYKYSIQSSFQNEEYVRAKQAFWQSLIINSWYLYDCIFIFKWWDNSSCLLFKLDTHFLCFVTSYIFFYLLILESSRWNGKFGILWGGDGAWWGNFSVKCANKVWWIVKIREHIEYTGSITVFFLYLLQIPIFIISVDLRLFTT